MITNSDSPEFDRLNIEPLYAISTGHLPNEVLMNITPDNGYGLVLYPLEYGALLWVPDHGHWQDCLDEDAAAFVPIIEWAQKHGLMWVKFDADAPEVGGLPTYGDDE